MHPYVPPFRRLVGTVRVLFPPKHLEAPPPAPPVFVRARVVSTQTRERRALVRTALLDPYGWAACEKIRATATAC